MTPMQWTVREGTKAFNPPTDRKPRQRIDPATRLAIIHRIIDGQQQARVARDMGVAEATVYRIIRKHESKSCGLEG